MRIFIIRLIVVTLILGVTFGLIFGQAGTCPAQYPNSVTTKSCFKAIQNFAERVTFQTNIVQKGSTTDSLLMQFTAGRFLFNYGNQFLSFGSRQTNIGSSITNGYSVGAGMDNIDLHQAGKDSILITFSGDTAYINGQHNVVAWQFTPKLNANSVNAWGLTGNAGTSPGTNFIGTTDGAKFKLYSSNDMLLVTDYAYKYKTETGDITKLTFDNGADEAKFEYANHYFNGNVGIGTGSYTITDNKLTVFGGFFDSVQTTYGHAVGHIGAFNLGLPLEGVYFGNGYTKLQLTYDENLPNKTNWHWSLGSEISKIEGDSTPTSGYAGTGEVRMKFTDGDSYYFDGGSLYSFSGIGTLGNNNSHWAGLYTDGLKLTDGTQANGKLLVSDSNGVASWQYPFTTMTTSKSGDGVSNVVTIPHLLAYTPTFVSAVPTSDDARGLFKATQDATNVYLTYTAPLTLGTNNLSYSLFLTK